MELQSVVLFDNQDGAATQALPNKESLQFITVKKFETQTDPPTHMWKLQPFMARICVGKVENMKSLKDQIELKVVCEEIGLSEVYSSELSKTKSESEANALLLVSILAPVEKVDGALVSIGVSCADYFDKTFTLPMRYEDI